ncbi:MAG: hypothetical protein UW73_C0027G0017 [Microgenomates group bacterium GW2011_GWB1_44_8]|nr:MAG: hypothetical protein UW73_C0027G0017 [Microgenomates group bacterium GW2011_GWB1_44_8]
MNWLVGIAILLAFGATNFWVWKNKRADYEEEGILGLWLWLVTVTWIASWGFRWWSLGGVLLAVACALVFWCRKKKWDVWEWADVTTRSSLVFAGSIALAKGSWIVGLGLWGGAVVLWVIAKTYRKWRWYKSGKMGLVALIGGIWWMGVWMLLAQRQLIQVYLAGLSIIAICVVIYLRSGWPKKLHILKK